jgi:Putative prokaryotic signal transducing protein
MREILKSNNVVELNFAEVVLKDARIAAVVLDTHMSILDGSMVIIPRRLMVADADEARARAILEDALASRAEWT